MWCSSHEHITWSCDVLMTYCSHENHVMCSWDEHHMVLMRSSHENTFLGSSTGSMRWTSHELHEHLIDPVLDPRNAAHVHLMSSMSCSSHEQHSREWEPRSTAALARVTATKQQVKQHSRVLLYCFTCCQEWALSRVLLRLTCWVALDDEQHVECCRNSTLESGRVLL